MILPLGRPPTGRKNPPGVDRPWGRRISGWGRGCPCRTAQGQVCGGASVPRAQKAGDPPILAGRSGAAAAQRRPRNARASGPIEDAPISQPQRSGPDRTSRSLCSSLRRCAPRGRHSSPALDNSGDTPAELSFVNRAFRRRAAPPDAPDLCNGKDFDVQAAETREGVSAGPNLQVLQWDQFYFT